jgi:diadenosine tetraphosphate (Ap4A) HIT family hydrolase
MTFTQEQAEKIKQQLLTQVDHLPNENKEQIKAYISQLDETQLEDFIRKNNIQIQGMGEQTESSESQPQGEGSENKGEGSSPDQVPPQGPTECIFCSIIGDKIPYYKIAENPKALAILEINPLAKGHTIILPKSHVAADKIPKPALSLAQKVSQKMRTKLKPDDVKIETSSFMGHAMVNVIPIYKGAQMQKRKAEESELKQMQESLQTKKRSPRVKTEKGSFKLPKLSFRIP